MYVHTVIKTTTCRVLSSWKSSCVSTISVGCGAQPRITPLILIVHLRHTTPLSVTLSCTKSLEGEGAWHAISNSTFPLHTSRFHDIAFVTFSLTPLDSTASRVAMTAYRRSSQTRLDSLSVTVFVLITGPASVRTPSFITPIICN